MRTINRTRRWLMPALLLGVLCWLVSIANGQFYYPDRVDYGTPADQGLAYRDIAFASSDGTKLHGRFVPATTGNAVGTVIHFHGNAQNLSAHFSFVAWLPQYGFNIFTFDYRGYGRSEGSAGRRGIHRDALAALATVQTLEEVDPTKLLVFGQSLGGAIAVSALGSTNLPGLCGVAVDSTFESYKAVAKDHAPDLLASIFIRNTLNPIKTVASIAPVPLLVIHGTADRVIPYARGKALFEAAGEPKQMWTVPDGHHTDALMTYAPTYRPRLVQFFKACLENGAHGPANELQR
jgi:fermentation-respiration switch protein FrsA (DUF1100 family)